MELLFISGTLSAFGELPQDRDFRAGATPAFRAAAIRSGNVVLSIAEGCPNSSSVSAPGGVSRQLLDAFRAGCCGVVRSTMQCGFLAGLQRLYPRCVLTGSAPVVSWCKQHGRHLFAARRTDIESFGRTSKPTVGRAQVRIARRLCAVCGLYRYAVEHGRRPRLDDESHTFGLDRNEVGALLVAAGLGPPRPAPEHALISLLASGSPACGR